MKHENYKELLELYVYDELNSEKRESVENHLLECEECTSQLEELKKFNLVINENVSAIKSEHLLANLREELFDKIEEETKELTTSEKIGNFLKAVLYGKYSFATAAALALIIGVFVGKSFFTKEQINLQNLTENSIDIDRYLNNNYRIAGVKFPDEQMGRDNIEIKFDSGRRLKLESGFNDPLVKEVLAKILESKQNPWLRMQTLNKISQTDNTKELVKDTTIKRAILRTIINDKNPAVRREALTSLRFLEYDTSIRNTLIEVLKKDENAGMRIMAINILSQIHPNIGKKDTLLESFLMDKKESDKNSYVRLRAAKLVEKNK